MLNISTAKLAVLWLLIVPTVFTYVALSSTIPTLNWLYVGMFTLFAFLTVLFPIRQQGKVVFLLVWITAPVFLMYGLLIEIIVSQIALLAIVVYNWKQPNKTERFLVNSLLFFVLSLLSASAFYLVGGELGTVNFLPLSIAVATYQMTHKVLYDRALYFVGKYISFTRVTFKDSLIMLLVLPFSISFYYLLMFIGFGTFFLLGIPYFFIVIISRMNNQAEKINRDMQRVGTIGHHLSYNLTEEEIMDEFVRQISTILRADHTYLFNNHSGWLELTRSYKYGLFKNPNLGYSRAKHNVAEQVLAGQELLIFDEKKGWINLTGGHGHSEMQSMIAIPYTKNEVVKGVLLVYSAKKRAFEEYQLKLADILCSYYTVSIEKARNLESTVKESERCGLTGLYNYIYLEDRLNIERKRLEEGSIETLTVMMLDIDHFKKVNDTYGHESGNDVLVELANILESETPKNSIVGRYGGEEFIYILPEIDKASAVQFGEQLRRKVEAKAFRITPDLGDFNGQINITITISVGLSSLPVDTNDANMLIRNADHALYIGAKRAGRNRVASYTK